MIDIKSSDSNYYFSILEGNTSQSVKNKKRIEGDMNRLTITKTTTAAQLHKELSQYSTIKLPSIDARKFSDSSASSLLNSRKMTYGRRQSVSDLEQHAHADDYEKELLVSQFNIKEEELDGL